MAEPLETCTVDSPFFLLRKLYSTALTNPSVVNKQSKRAAVQ
jgi:hypothetical protein